MDSATKKAMATAAQRRVLLNNPVDIPTRPPNSPKTTFVYKKNGDALIVSAREMDEEERSAYRRK